MAPRVRRALPAVTPRGGRPARRWAGGLLTAVVLAVAARLVYGRGTLGYDAAWAVLWGEQLAHGRLPDLAVAGAPTPHPLAIVVAAVTGANLTVALSWLAFGALGVAGFALGSGVYSRWVGALFAALLLTRPLLVLEAGQAVTDVPFLALVLAAMAVEARRPRTGWTVPVLLGLAGLLRPEAWLLAVAWALWAARVRRDRLALAVAALAAPVLWAAFDLAATGNPLHSLHSTQALAAQLGRPREVDTALRSTPGYLHYALTGPVVWLGLAGCAAAIAGLYARTLLPLAVAGLGLLAFLALGVSGLPLLSRYLLLPAALLALWCAVLAFGFTVVPSRAWQAAGAAALVVLAVSAPALVDRLRGMVAFVGTRAAVEQDLVSIVRAPDVRAAITRCGGVVSVPDDAPAPIARRLVARVRVRGAHGVTLRYADERVRSAYRIALSEPVGAPPGQHRLAANASWVASVAPGGCAP
jgi:hypothetical protein